MKQLFSLLFILLSPACHAQSPQFIIHNLSLPQEIAYYNNQFSSLYIHSEKLFLMSESRLEDNAEAKLYAINLADLDRKIKDTAYALPFKKYPVHQLETLRNNITAAGQSYEGLEAMIINSNAVYFSVETATPSPDCYLLKGSLSDTAVVMDTNFLVLFHKPVNKDNPHIYNAGFEAMEQKDSSIFGFFEYNYFPGQNNVYVFNMQHTQKNSSAQVMTTDKIPFRVTDITSVGGNHFTAINYFFKGGGGDTIYRVPVTDVNDKLIRDKTGYKNYCRLIDVTYTNDHFTWKPLWQFPELYQSYNWEGIAGYKAGYFIINDKYTPARPYQSTLLYLEKK